MATLLQQLQGDDTLLLMYLVGELPAADRAEVDRQLVADAKLRADLDRLSETYGSFTSGMEALDASTPMVADVSAAVRRASTAIRQWQARPAPVLTAGVEHRAASSRWRVWAIPSAAAAIVLLVLGISLRSGWNTSSPQARGPDRKLPFPTPVVPQVSPEQEELANLIAQSPGTDTLAVAGPGFDSDLTRDESISKALHEDGAVLNVPEP